MSSQSTAQTIIRASKLYTVSVYPPLFILGVIGNLLNVLIFGSFRLFRRHQCAFYLTVESLANFALLIIVLPFRTADYYFDYDPLRLSLAWCKLRQALVTFCSSVSFLSVCYAAIDQYLSSHYYPQLRRWSTLKLAHRLTIWTVLLLIIYSIPFLVFFEIDPSAGCVSTNPSFLKFYSYVHFCVFNGLIPITVPTLFAALAYINVRRIVRRQLAVIRRRLDRQLTAMVLTKVVFLVITTLPFVILRIYRLNTSIPPDDRLRMVVEQLIYTIASSLYYVNAAVGHPRCTDLVLLDSFQGTFYVLFIVSRRFRQQTRQVVVKNIWKKFCSSMLCRTAVVRVNQISPESDGTDPEHD